MIVPHGRSRSEWLRNADTLVREVGRCTVGIPRLLSARCGDGTGGFRVRLAAAVKQRHPQVDVHLLGAGEDFLVELSMLRETPHVRSVDSTFLHRYGYSGADPNRVYVPPLPLNDPAIPNGFEARVCRLARTLNSALRGRATCHD